MPWFGMDIGGTLTKLVYFEPLDTKYMDNDETLLAAKIHHYLLNNKAYGETGIRDDHLQLNRVMINGCIGSLHFIRFPSEQMTAFIALARDKNFAKMASTVCATGGGAIKFAPLTEKMLCINLRKADELHSLVKGIELIAANETDECYYYENPLDPQNFRKVMWHWSTARSSSTHLHSVDSHKDGHSDGLQYPYVVCNIGSGVSVLVVRAHNDFQRISGSSIGGGFFHAICSLCCNIETFEDAVELAALGDNRNVDKLVSDIYGGGYDDMGLPADTVAASFGKLCSMKTRANANPADIARAALVTVMNNLGSITLNAAYQHGVDRIVFVGNFLRVNEVAARHLSHAMEYWSKGTKKALFLKHEGYFGAIGCLDKLVDEVGREL